LITNFDNNHVVWRKTSPDLHLKKIAVRFSHTLQRELPIANGSFLVAQSPSGQSFVAAHSVPFAAGRVEAKRTVGYFAMRPTANRRLNPSE
jgi:hypothetical protein